MVYPDVSQGETSLFSSLASNAPTLFWMRLVAENFIRVEAYPPYYVSSDLAASLLGVKLGLTV